ncbi:hypothetical protein GCM10027596_13130 [Nocardioides korecus]
MHEGDPVAERPEPLTGALQGVGVAVDADHAGLGAALEHGLAVTTQAEGGVEEDRAGAVERGRQQRDDPVEEDRDVEGARHGSFSSRTGPGR